MLRKLLSVVLLALFSICAYAQVSKPKILVKEFERVDGVSSDDCERIRQNVLHALDATDRFVMTDVEFLRKSSDDTAELTNLVEGDFDYIVEGKVILLDVNDKMVKEERKYNYSYGFSLTFTDVKGSKNIITENYERTSYFSYDTKEDALNQISGDISSKLSNTITVQLPLVGKLITIDYTSKKNKIVNCYIDLGSDLGAKKDMYFEIRKPTYRAGRTIYTKVARLKIIEVLDGTLSHCKITSDGKDLFNALKDYMELDEATRESRPFKVVSVLENNIWNTLL